MKAVIPMRPLCALVILSEHHRFSLRLRLLRVCQPPRSNCAPSPNQRERNHFAIHAEWHCSEGLILANLRPLPTERTARTLLSSQAAERSRAPPPASSRHGIQHDKPMPRADLLFSQTIARAGAEAKGCDGRSGARQRTAAQGDPLRNLSRCPVNAGYVSAALSACSCMRMWDESCGSIPQRIRSARHCPASRGD